MLTAVTKIAGASAKYYAMQQASLGALNGYIEETVTGQHGHIDSGSFFIYDVVFVSRNYSA